MKQAFSIARASTYDQIDTLPAQLANNTRYAERNNISIIKESVLRETGWKSKRKLFKELVAEIELFVSKSKEPLHLIFDKVDRLTRKVDIHIINLEALRELGKIEMHFPNDNLIYHKNSPAVDEAKFDMAILFAKNYSNSVRDNVKRTFAYLKTEGRILGAAPLGYLNKGSGVVEIDEHRKAYIVRIFDLYSTGRYSTLTISKIMYDEGLRSHKGKRVSDSRINEMLKNEFYNGQLRGIAHKYPIFINRSIFMACQDILAKRNKNRLKTVEIKPFLLRQLVRCKECNSFYSGYIVKDKYIYYRGSNKNCTTCYNNHVREEILAKQFEIIIDKIKFPKELQDWTLNRLKDNVEQERRYVEFKRSELDRKRKQLIERQDRVLDAFLDGDLTKEEKVCKNLQIKQELRGIELELSKLVTRNENVLEEMASMLTLLRRTKEIYQSSNVQQKNAILKFITSNCVLLSDSADIYLKKPFNICVDFDGQAEWRDFADSLLTFDPTELNVLSGPKNV